MGEKVFLKSVWFILEFHFKVYVTINYGNILIYLSSDGGRKSGSPTGLMFLLLTTLKDSGVATISSSAVAKKPQVGMSVQSENLA